MTGKEFLENLGCIGYCRVRVSAKSGRSLMEGVGADDFPMGRIYGPEGVQLSEDDFLGGQVEVSSKDELLAFVKGKVGKDDIIRF